VLMGNRVSAAVELEGLDIPEMGALAYPDFVLGSGTSAASAAMMSSTAPAAAASLKPVQSDV
jgi:hypothetical protein